jgi:hypothetical protein
MPMQLLVGPYALSGASKMVSGRSVIGWFSAFPAAGSHPAARNARPQTFFLPITMLDRAHRMPTAKIAVPNTKTWGGMPTRVAP